MDEDNRAADAILEDLENESERLTNWEAELVANVTERRENGWDVTGPQLDALANIHKKLTRPGF